MKYGDDGLVSSAVDSVGANGDRVMSLAVDQSVKTDISKYSKYWDSRGVSISGIGD